MIFAHRERDRSKLELISDASRVEIDKWIAKYPENRQQSAVMAALRIVQDQNGGYLTNALIEAVAEYLHMQPIAVYEIATFYSMYELRPVGRHVISVCTNISCALCGSDRIMTYLQNKLGIKIGETTEDGRFTLREVECMGACVHAPTMQIGRRYHENLTPEKLDRILEELD